MGLFDFIDVQPASERSWRPQPPPPLDNIHAIELDVETDGLDWRRGKRIGGIGICKPDGTTQYMPMRHAGGNNLDEAQVLEWARRELRNKHVTNISTKFDLHMLREWGVNLEEQGCTVADVAYDAALLDESRQKFSLEVLCKENLSEEERKVTEVLGVPLDASQMMSYPAEYVAVRCEADVRQVHFLKHIFAKQIAMQGLTKVWWLENHCIFPVCEMERLGAPLDTEKLHRWLKECEAAINALSRELIKDSGFVMNPDRNADWVQLFERLHLPLPTQQTEKGAISFTDALLKTLKHPTIDKARRLKKLMSLCQKYLVPYAEAVGSDGLLFYNLHQLRQDDYGTVSGRFSASDKNIQQVMDAEKQAETFGDEEFLIRELFIAALGEGGKRQHYLSADAKQIEFRGFAHYAKSPKIDAEYRANPNVSFHDIVHAEICKLKPDTKYKTAKFTNFALLYGAGRDKTAAMIGLSREESDKFVEVYKTKFPEAKKLSQRAMDLASSRGYVKTLLGRRARFPNKEKIHKALNSVIQGGAADVMKQKIVELHQRRKWTGFTMRYTVHDEVCGDVPDMESAQRVQTALNWQSFKMRIPILWDVATGPDWAHVTTLPSTD